MDFNYSADMAFEYTLKRYKNELEWETTYLCIVINCYKMLSIQCIFFFLKMYNVSDKILET